MGALTRSTEGAVVAPQRFVPAVPQSHLVLVFAATIAPLEVLPRPVLVGMMMKTLACVLDSPTFPYFFANYGET